MGDLKTYKMPIWLVILAIVGLFALFFVRLGSYPLADPDEPVYGQIAKEMAGGAGWLTPHYNGRPWFDKPPMFYWLSGAAMKIIGPAELACRLPSAILAVAVVLLLYALVKHDFGKRAALFASIAMATCLQTIVLARAAVTDMTLCFCLLGALYAYRRWYGEIDSSEGKSPPHYSLTPNRCSLPWMMLCGAMAGLGMLTKGPVAPVLLVATFLIHLCWSKQLRRLISLDVLAGIVATLIVGLPWFVAMYNINHDSFVHQFIEQNNIARFTTAEHKETTGGWYSIFMNIPVLFVFFFPWSVFLTSGVLRFRSANAGARLAWVWFAVVFVFFSISKTQLVTYIFPLYPAAALFVGVLFDRAASGEIGCGNAVRRGLIAGVVIAVLFAVAILKYSHKNFPEAKVAAVSLGVVLLLTLLVALLARRDQLRVGWTIGTGMAVFTLVLMFGVLPAAVSRISTRDIVRGLPRSPNVGALYLDLQKKKTSVLFYLGYLPKSLNSFSEAKDLLAKKEAAWVICNNKEADLLSSEGCVETARAGDLRVVANKAAAEQEGPRRN